MTLCRWAVVPDVSNAPRSFVTSLAQRPQGYIPEALNLRDKSLCHVRFNCIKLSCRDRTDFNVGPPKTPKCCLGCATCGRSQCVQIGRSLKWAAFLWQQEILYGSALSSSCVLKQKLHVSRLPIDSRDPPTRHDTLPCRGGGGGGRAGVVPACI